MRVDQQPHQCVELVARVLAVDVGHGQPLLVGEWVADFEPRAPAGGEAMVQTLNGQVSMKVPPETQPGRIIRLRGQGMPSLRDPQQRGDLYVKVQAQLPQHLSADEKKLFEQLAKMRQ